MEKKNSFRQRKSKLRFLTNSSEKVGLIQNETEITSSREKRQEKTRMGKNTGYYAHFSLQHQLHGNDYIIIMVIYPHESTNFVHFLLGSLNYHWFFQLVRVFAKKKSLGSLLFEIFSKRKNFESNFTYVNVDYSHFFWELHYCSCN